jgi:glycosyltransferase involved in cell wall biosynthesis
VSATDTPAVSVVIPAFDRAAEIPTAIASVLGQSFPDFELIVVDDASTDDTVAVVEAIDDPRLRVLRQAVNLGPAAARNAGAAVARAPIVAFLDSDDTWRERKLERQLAFMRARGLAISCTGFELVREGRPGSETRLPDPPRLEMADMIENADVCLGTTMIVARDLFETVGPFDERMRRLEDWDWLLRLGTRQALHFVPEALAVHLAPASRAAIEPTRAAARLILDKHLDAVGAVNPALRRQLRAMTERHLAAASWISGQPLSAVGHGLRALSLRPSVTLDFARRRFLRG